MNLIKNLLENNYNNEKIWLWDDKNNKKLIEMTVCLPIFSSYKYIWFVLESLKNQINICFSWELIIFEEKDLSKDVLNSYIGKLPGCVRIIYKIIIKKNILFDIKNKKNSYSLYYYKLLKTIINISTFSDFNSKIFVIQSMYCYSSPKRLYIHYEHFKNKMCYYSTQSIGYIYNIKKDKWLTYNDCLLKSENINTTDILIEEYNLNIALKTYIIKKIKLSSEHNILSINKYILSNILEISDIKFKNQKIIFTDDEIDKNNWMNSLNIDIDNNIYNFTIKTSDKNKYDYYQIIDKNNLKYNIPNYIIPSLKIDYFKNNKNIKISKKILINKEFNDLKVLKLLNKLNIIYDIINKCDIKLYKFKNYFLFIDDSYDTKIYKRCLTNKIYYYCPNSSNNHILNKIDEKLIKKMIFRIKCMNEISINDIYSIIKNRRVLIMSIWDYGFSGYNMYISLKNINENVDYFNFNIEHRNKVLGKNIKNTINKDSILNKLNYDVLLFKGDYNLFDNDIDSLHNNDNIISKYIDMNILLINIVGGSFYRNNFLNPIKKISLNKVSLQDKFYSFDFVFSLTHDLCYYFDTLYFGHKMIQLDYNYKQNNIIKICHSPSSKKKKGTAEIEKAISLVKKKYNVDFIMLINLSQDECIKIKQQCDLFIDQIYTGGYGNSLIEAISIGIPSMVYIKNINIDPLINIKPNVQDIQNKIENFIKLSKCERKIISLNTYKYFLKYHTFDHIPYNIIKNKEIVVISLNDCGNLAYDFVLFLKKYTLINVSYALINEKNKKKYNIKIDNIYKNDILFNKKISSSDIIWIFGDEPFKEYYKYINLEKKKVICTVVGNYFRRDYNNNFPYISDRKLKIYNYFTSYYKKWDLKDYENVILISCTPELIPLNYNKIFFIPSVIEINENENYYIKNKNYNINNKEIIITHMAKNYNKKGTMYIRGAINLLKKEYNINYIELNELNELNEENILNIKKKSTLFIDQCFAGWYGKSLIQAISYGIPSICYTSPLGKYHFSKFLKNIDLPIVNIIPNSYNIYSVIKDIIDHDRFINLSRRTFQYYNNVHIKYTINNINNILELVYQIDDINIIYSELKKLYN